MTQDIADALDRLAAAPARAVEQIAPPATAADPAEDVETRWAPWSSETER